ncbi:unnamed protein product [Rotaria sordida]|uniref:Uncharacterized protein n=1 Tax=Rotaria sordida TaxID=392033 RepID=A0A814QY01_9BILA|nr:unnamed protein product [Rotaria sordida]
MDPLPLGRCSVKNSSGTKIQCSRWAILICSHCNQGVCLEHHDIHQHEIQIRTHQLNNRINDLRQILHTLTYQQMIDNFQEKIDQWSQIRKNEIDLKHAQMSVQLLNEIKQINIDQFRLLQLNNIEQYIGQPLTDILHLPNNIQMKHIESLEQQLEQIQQTIQEIFSCLQITNDGQLKIDQSITLINNYSTLSSLYKHSLNDCPGAMAGSPLHQDYLLVFQSKPYFSLVFIEDNKHITRIPIDCFVNDICWSQTTQVFLITTEYYLYEFYPLNNRLSEPYGNSKSNRTLWTSACNSTDLYIIHKPDMIMYQRDIKKPFEKKREWQKNDIMCEEGDQFIASIRIDEQRQILALSIKQCDNRWRVDFFLIVSMQRLYCGSSFGIPTEIHPCYCMITPLLNHHNQWLVQYCTSEKCQCVILNEKAQVINQIDRNGFNITLIGRDKIAFLDHNGIEIYRR